MDFKDRIFRWSSRRTLLGVPVGAFLAGRGKRAILFTKVEQALLLIRALHPRRFEQVRRDVGRILVFGVPAARGAWHDGPRICELDEAFVADPDTTPAEVACVIVHEATHARLDRLGFRYRECERGRIERACYRTERAFARRLPGGESLVREFDAMVERARDPAPWADAARLRAVLEEMRGIGVPERFAQALVRWAGRRRAAEQPAGAAGSPARPDRWPFSCVSPAARAARATARRNAPPAPARPASPVPPQQRPRRAPRASWRAGLLTGRAMNWALRSGPGTGTTAGRSRPPYRRPSRRVPVRPTGRPPVAPRPPPGAAAGTESPAAPALPLDPPPRCRGLPPVPYAAA